MLKTKQVSTLTRLYGVLFNAPSVHYIALLNSGTLNFSTLVPVRWTTILGVKNLIFRFPAPVPGWISLAS